MDFLQSVTGFEISKQPLSSGDLKIDATQKSTSLRRGMRPARELSNQTVSVKLKK